MNCRNAHQCKKNAAWFWKWQQQDAHLFKFATYSKKYDRLQPFDTQWFQIFQDSVDSISVLFGKAFDFFHHICIISRLERNDVRQKSWCKISAITYLLEWIVLIVRKVDVQYTVQYHNIQYNNSGYTTFQGMWIFPTCEVLVWQHTMEYLK